MRKINVVDKWTNFCEYEGDCFGIVDGFIFIRDKAGDPLVVIAPGFWAEVHYADEETK